jgi:hypothetical protein
MSQERSVRDVFGPYKRLMERAMGIEPKSEAWDFFARRFMPQCLPVFFVTISQTKEFSSPPGCPFDA